MYLPDSIFREIVNFTPLIAIDFVITDENNRILLGRRRNRPAFGKWFVPGGRIQKSEFLDDSFSRISKSEIGIALKRSDHRLLGIYEHHYEDSIYEDVSTHYVILAYHIDGFTHNVSGDNQHDKFTWYKSGDHEVAELIHPYTKKYLEDLCL